MTKINKGTFSLLFILAMSLLYVGCCTAMSSCSYEMRKGAGCLGATGIKAAKPSYRGR